MHEYLIEMLTCPACHGALAWTITEHRGDRIETAEVHCTGCAAAYPVREGIGLFLTPDLPRNDLWEQVDSQLVQYLRAHPHIERQLMDVPLETLAPADQFFRALVLEERGDYAQARAAKELANIKIYTPEYRACCESQFDHVIERLSTSGGPIVDLASGQGYLVEELARRLDRPIIATDMSPRVLRRNRKWFEFFGLYDAISLLAFDARRTPFKDGAVETMTTFLGLLNIEEPGDLLRELRRVVAGTFLSIMHFFPEDDQANAAKIREVGLSALSFRASALECFAAAGWQTEVANACTGRACPTPTGVVLEGIGIDGLPVVDTMLEWSVLIARRRM
ncbi:MAG: methyltransferase domain-containing protein [Chloroflexi bacterium]|nr:methyltransferase domain-containing protein [Chloroflexota bacterium]MBU1749910.1 methyltransferase domain-containing protein [Chloroflexota bacterium]MBU1879370.1 methyltransferase domain-containing protein [Chloroflexota bacterium]